MLLAREDWMVAISLDAFISGQGTVGHIGLASMYICT